MSRLLGRQQRAADMSGFNPLTAAYAARTGGKGAVGTVPTDQALRLSVAWACRRLRADLVSTMPVDVYRRVAGSIPLGVPKPPVFVTPGGARCRWIEWLYSTQADLDQYGNAFGVIEARDGSGRPQVIRLVPAERVTVTIVADTGQVTYRVGGQTHAADEVWHERAYTSSGVAVGLSPIAYAALTLQTSLSASQYAATWFGGHATPAAHLRNTARTLNKGEATRTKSRYLAQMAEGDVFVSGSDWEFNMLQAKASESMFLEQLGASNADVCRYYGVPGDMVDVHVDTSTVTYANITQRNLQFLIMNLNPALIRREDAFSHDLLAEPRYAKFNRSALLQMDPQTRAQTIQTRIDSRTLTPDEARELEELPPLTPDQEAQYARLWPKGTGTPTSGTNPQEGST